jgi:hypothetical protein
MIGVNLPMVAVFASVFLGSTISMFMLTKNKQRQKYHPSDLISQDSSSNWTLIKYCTNCGMKVEHESHYCNSCGFQLL